MSTSLSTSPLNHFPANSASASTSNSPTSTTTSPIPPPCEPRKHRQGSGSGLGAAPGKMVGYSRSVGDSGGWARNEEGGESALGAGGAGGGSGLKLDVNGNGGTEAGRRWGRAVSIPIDMGRGNGKDRVQRRSQGGGDGGDGDWDMVGSGEGEESEELMDEDFGMGPDNSARYYYHNPHTYPHSTSTSPSKARRFLSPENMHRHPGSSNRYGHSPNNLLSRRNFSLPPETNDRVDLRNGMHVAIPGGNSLDIGYGSMRSPTLSPTMMTGTSIGPDGQGVVNGRTVILTPTTTEWRALGLANLRDLGGERGGEEGDSGSGSGSESGSGGGSGPASGEPRDEKEGFDWDMQDVSGQERRGSGVSGRQNADNADDIILSVPSRGTRSGSWTGIKRGSSVPSSRGSMRDPDSAPAVLEEGDLFARLMGIQSKQRVGDGSRSPSRRVSVGTPGLNGAGPVITLDDGPGNSGVSGIGRSQSMKAPGEGTNRKEKERERLFRLVGEEVEKNGLDKPTGSWGIRQIGNGGGLSAPGRKSLDGDDDTDMDFASGGLRTESMPSIATVVANANLPDGLPAPHGQHALHPSPLSTTNSVSQDTPMGSPIDEKASVPMKKPPTRQHSRAPTATSPNAPIPTPLSPMTSRRRQSQRLSNVAGRTPQPFGFPAALPPSAPGARKPSSSHLLNAFSPFTSVKATPRPTPAREISHLSIPHYLKAGDRSDSSISLAPSTTAPSAPATPHGETVGGIGGHGIDDYIIIEEAGKGAYGLVKRAKQRDYDGHPIGEEVIIKYIIKSRILADCWKKHKVLGPIPIEIHVMDQLRNVPHKAPIQAFPWDPLRPGHETSLENDNQARPTSQASTGHSTPTTIRDVAGNSQVPTLSPSSTIRDGEEDRQNIGGFLGLNLNGRSNPLDWHAHVSSQAVKNMGHPNVCKMLDFFEDKEFYYLVMPRFGVGLDLFDRVESCPEGLPPFDIRSLLGQLSDALRFLHSNGIVHRDIKDENVILDGQGHCQLIDFGSAAHWRPGRKWDTFSGTLDYASPEILRGELYSGKEQDVWALGVVGYVLICGETPFLSAEEAQAGLGSGTKAYLALMERCGGLRGQEGLEYDSGGRMKHAYDFVARCLELRPEERPSADLLCKHRYLIGGGGWLGHKGWIGMEG